MKVVKYSRNDIHVLTDAEFKELLVAWREKQDYYCERLEITLPPSKNYPAGNLPGWHDLDILVCTQAWPTTLYGRHRKTGVTYMHRFNDDGNGHIWYDWHLSGGLEKLQMDTAEEWNALPTKSTKWEAIDDFIRGGGMFSPERLGLNS